MNLKSALYLLAVLLFIVAPKAVCAEESAGGDSFWEESSGSRAIYIGDIITLNIMAGISEEQLAEKFSGFEITEIKNIPGGYALSMRTFMTGEHRIVIGNKEIVINIRSAAEDIERNGLFDGDARVIGPGFPFYWRAVFYAAACGFALTGAFLLFAALQKERAKNISPRKLFMMRSGALSVYDRNFFVDLTYCFKEYIGSVHKRKIIGKTSAEIIEELSDIGQLESFIPEIKKWLADCDRMKFTGIEPSAEEKRGHCSALIGLVREIDEKNTGMTGETEKRIRIGRKGAAA